MKQATDKIGVRFAWLEEHIPYEIKMLSEVHKLLDWTEPPLPEGVMLNALIESFCVHARVLIELIQDESAATESNNGKQQYYALSSGFSGRGDYGSYVPMLNNQIAHLGELRESDPANKLDRAHRVALVDLLRRDVATLKSSLKPQYRPPKCSELPDVGDFSGTPPTYLTATPLPPSACSAAFGTTVEISAYPGVTTSAEGIKIIIHGQIRDS